MLAAVLAAAGWAGAPEPAEAQYFAFGKNRVQYEAHAWRFLEAEHFDVYYYEGGEALARFAATAAETAHADVEALFQSELTERTPLLIYQGHAAFAATNAVNLPPFAEGIGGATELFKNRIVVPFTGDYRAFRQVIHHEVVHAAVNDLFYGGSVQSIIRNNIELRIPPWFNEGLAEYAATGWGTEPDRYVRAAVLDDALPPAERLRGYLAYPGGQSLWDYVGEQYGREKIGEVLHGLRETRSVEKSFQSATGLTLDALSERWHKALREVYYPELAARESLEEIAAPVDPHAEARYYGSPALAPKGDRLAYIAADGARFGVYLARASTGEVLGELIRGQTSAGFESLRPQVPGLSWSPDGTEIAVAVKSGPADAIAVVDAGTGEAEHVRVEGVDQISGVAWHPAARQIAFSGVKGAQSDIFVLDLETREAVNYTDDVFGDHAPAWRPDGAVLVFHSDRGPHVEVGRHGAEAFDMAAYASPKNGAPGHALYALPLGARRAERLTSGRGPWDDYNAQFGPEGERLLFISDRNGIPNLYEKDLVTGAERPLTDLTSGVTQAALSADGQQAAVVSLRRGTPSLYLLRAPFARRVAADDLAPTVWAQRVMGRTEKPAPALALAPEARQRSNPFLRAAAVGEESGAPGLLALHAFWEQNGGGGLRGLTPAASAPASSVADTTADPAATYGAVRVQLGGDDRAEGGQAPTPSEAGQASTPAPAEPALAPKKYKLNFSPDLIYGAAGYDALYGVQGVAQMRFSDMMGNHQILLTTNLLVDLRNADYALSYSYLPHRTDWRLSVYHTARLLPDYARRTYYRYRRYGTSLRASYPLDTFHRVDLDAGVVGVSQADIGNPARPQVTRVLFNPALTFTRDVTTPGFFAPQSGHRLAVSLSGTAGPIRFVTLLADARTYASFGPSRRYGLALRLSGGTSFGSTRQLFYAAGVENWLNRRFDPVGGFPVDGVADFAFATPVMPLRGHDFNAQRGSSFGLFNAEWRFPLGAFLGDALTGLLPVYALRGAAFADVGGVWGGPGPGGAFRAFRQNAEGDRVFDDLLVGAGGGVRTLVLGYPVRLDVAWPYNGQRFGAREVYLSVGFNF